MKTSLKHFITGSLTLLGVLASLLIAPATAQATSAVSLVVRETSQTLAGTTISGLENAAHLKVTFTVNDGIINFDPSEAPLVSVAPGSTAGTASLVLLGTQSNLNAAFDKVHLTSCSQNLTIGASVMDTDQLSMFSSNGHAYKWVNAGHNLDWHAAKAAAEAMTFDNAPGSQTGYLVTITSQAESDFVTRMVLGQNLAAWMGASDSLDQVSLVDPATTFDYGTIEGHWHWVTGPEAGSRFYDQGTGNLPGAFSNWAPSEPNNSRGFENVGMLRSDSTWNDKNEYTGNQIDSFVVEFGGMAGNSLSSSISSSATYSRPFGNICASTRPVLTVTAGAGGVAPVTEYSDQNGDYKVITPTPNSGFQVDTVTLDGTPASLVNNQLTLANVLADHHVVVSFSRASISQQQVDFAGPEILSAIHETATTLGGTEIKISGNRLGQVAWIALEGEILKIVSQTNNQIVILTPAHHEGYVSLFLKSDSSSLLFQDAFTYKNPPTTRLPVVTSKSISLRNPAARKLSTSERKTIASFVRSAQKGSVLTCTVSYSPKFGAVNAKALAATTCSGARDSNLALTTKVSTPRLNPKATTTRVILSLKN